MYETLIKRSLTEQILACATVQPRKWLDDFQSRMRLNSAAHERRARKSWTIQFNITKVTATMPLHFTSNSQQQDVLPSIKQTAVITLHFALCACLRHRQCQDDAVETACENMMYTSRRCRVIEPYYTWTRCLRRGMCILCAYKSKRCCGSGTCIHCVYLNTVNTEWHVYIQIVYVYTSIDDAEEEACVYIVYTSKRCMWRGMFIRHDDVVKKTCRRHDAVEKQFSTSRWSRWCRGCGMSKHQEDDMGRTCIHVETMPCKRLLFIIQMIPGNGRCMFSRQDDVAGEACSNVNMSPWKEDPIYSPDSMTEVRCHSLHRQVLISIRKDVAFYFSTAICTTIDLDRDRRHVWRCLCTKRSIYTGQTKWNFWNFLRANYV